MLNVTIKELRAIIESSQDMREAAKKAKMSHNTLYYNLKKYNLKVVKKLKVVKNL